jgi:hypothetical protein
MYITSQQYFRFIFRNPKFDDKIKIFFTKIATYCVRLKVDWLAGICNYTAFTTRRVLKLIAVKSFYAGKHKANF